MGRIGIKMVVWMMAYLFLASGALAYAQPGDQKESVIISQWEMLWEAPGQKQTIEEVMQLEDEHWFDVMADEEYPTVPDEVSSAWLKIQLPELTDMRPAILFEKLYAKDVVMYIDGEVVFERYKDYKYNLNEIVIPLFETESNQEIYININKGGYKLGLFKEVNVGYFDSIFKKFTKTDLVDVILGAALIIISFFMLISALFVNRNFLPGWNSLFTIMFCIGIMILTYSTLIEKIYPQLGLISYYAFDVASTILIPAFFFFFEKVFGNGPYRLISMFKKVQFAVAFFSIFLLSGSFIFDSMLNIYSSVGMFVFSSAALIGNVILLGALVYQCWYGNKDAIILSSGLGIFLVVGIGEMVWYYVKDRQYEMFYWKISLLFFLAGLIIIMVRKVMRNYEQAILYSKQIEVFNNELQRAERIETISQLAASVAHEVRNPLQVTRGFLQLLGGRMNDSHQKYMHLAINELDRASEIITDFLTFAKPDLGEEQYLNIGEEVRQIEVILGPLATLHGGVLQLNIIDDVYIQGNSSKFKQALINLIKNSIEAFNEEGIVSITVKLSKEPDEIIISIKDNGEGIAEEDIARLGEPYYSKKTKGTGLGLMVTYRIIEAMQGKLHFKSKVGVGTEVLLIFPCMQKADEG
ncbi:HAMP domain-containing histidine kinase [Paenibacillus sp. J5C_2022]|uniref:sensor histidine kinase n=1 Tax=Paenibacillus sp. J5C2022 TaxID=2977129 RepID=UPI0021CE78A9|nr:HAMP domain-containing sensor histidine kinase [Paenibacillus sp. J5C2022]MCU6711787.1 HAMP domain-containing histidine kinase [Paenibacillus sp. J5C2022]